MGQHQTYDWPNGWHGLHDTEARALKAEVLREINNVHALSGHPFEVIGRSDTGAAVVLAVMHWDAPYATLELTWPPEKPVLQKLFGALPDRCGPALHPIDTLTALRPAAI